MLLSKLGVDGVDKPTEKNEAVEASVIFTPSGDNDSGTDKPGRHDFRRKRTPSGRGALLQAGYWSHGGERASYRKRGNRSRQEGTRMR